MVLKYRGAPPFKVPVQTIEPDTELAFSTATERTLRTVATNIYKVFNASSTNELIELRNLASNPDAIELVKWSDEGLSDPDSGSEYIYKVTIPAGSKVIIAIPYQSVKPAVTRAKIYIATDGVAVKINRSATRFNDVALNNGLNVSEVNVSGEYRYISIPTVSPFGGIQFVNIVFDNTGGTSDGIVYLAYVIIVYVSMYSYKPSVVDGKITTTATGISVYYGIVLPPDTTYELWFVIGLTSDGTNTVSASIALLTDLGYETLTTVSTTSSTRTAWSRPYVVKVENRNGKWYPVNVRISFSNPAGISAEFDWQIQIINAGKEVRVQNIYDEGTIAVSASTSSSTAVFDFTSSAYYADVTYLEISSDSASLTVHAEDEYGNRLTPDVSNGSYTLPVELKRLRKLVLVYSNTATTTQNVGYKIHYRKYDGFLVR